MVDFDRSQRPSEPRLGGLEIDTETVLRATDVPDCPLCGERGRTQHEGLRDSRLKAPGSWSILSCPGCRTMWISPRAHEDEFSKIYGDYYTHGPPRSVGGRMGTIRDSLLSGAFGYEELRPRSRGARLLGALAAWVGPVRETVELGIMTLRGRSRGTLLDVGCGTGAFLSKMEGLGWEVEGQDVDPQAIEVARSRGLKVHEGPLPECDLEGRDYDAITMNHVLEHVPDPVSTLRVCRAALRRGGKLVVTTPNTASIGHRIFRERWFHLDVPRHLILFDPANLETCAKNAGLEVRDVWTASRSAALVWMNGTSSRRGFDLMTSRSVTRRAASWSFLLLEHAATHLFRKRGEEIVLVASRS